MPQSAFLTKVNNIIDSLDETLNGKASRHELTFRDYIQLAQTKSSKSVLNKERKKVYLSETVTKLPTTAIVKDTLKLNTPKHFTNEYLMPSLLSPKEGSTEQMHQLIDKNKVTHLNHELKVDVATKVADYLTP